MIRYAAVSMAVVAMVIGAPLALAADPGAAADSSAQQQAESRLRDAQQRLEQAAREVADLSLSMSDGARREIRQIIRTRRPGAVMGMAIDMRDEGGANRDAGVRIVSVSPGGAAEAAGLKANDVIVSFDGKALKREGDRSPQQQLLDLIGEAKPDAAVAIEYRRDGKVAKAQVTPRRPPDVLAGGARRFTQVLPAPGVPGVPDMPFMFNDGNGRGFRFIGRDDSGFGSAELTELSPALGAYFGTDKGLLVVRAPSDQRFKLQDGDVILDIDGRVPGSAAHAYQILNSYRSGEKLKLHIMRQKKRVELAVDVPERVMTR